MNALRAALLAPLFAATAACARPIVAPLRYDPVPPLPEEPFRAVAPEATATVPSVSLPFRVTTLANGVRVVLLERHTVPVVAVRLVTARGHADTGAPPDTIALLERAMRQGTALHTGPELAMAYARMGAAHGVSLGGDGCALTTKVASEDVGEAIALIAEKATQPRLNPANLTSSRASWLQDFAASGDAMKLAVARSLARVLWGPNHPYGFLRPTPLHTAAIRVEDLVALHGRLFHPAHTTLVVVGDATPAAVDAAAERALGTWAATAPPLARPALPPAAPGPSIVLIENNIASQAYAVVAAHGPSADDADLVALDVLASALGASSSALRGEVRVESGAAYIFGAGVSRSRGGSSFIVGGDFDPAKAPAALHSILAAIAEVRRAGIAARDLDRARTTLIAGWRSRLASDEGIAALVGDALDRDLPLESIVAYARRAEAVTVDDIRRVAQRYLGDRDLHVVVSGRPALRAPLDALGLGPVTRLDGWGDFAR